VAQSATLWPVPARNLPDLLEALTDRDDRGCAWSRLPAVHLASLVLAELEARADTTMQQGVDAGER
jgi:hypothetical protein